MHEHRNSVAILVTDGRVKFQLPDGKSQHVTVKAGDPRFAPAGKHLPENIGDKPFEVVLVEPKSI